MLPQLAELKVEQPALFIAGERDPVLRFVRGVDVTALMDSWYNDLRGKKIIAGAGHWIQQERPKEVNEALLSFLSGLG
jgi:pimeloyl-ACP methyl ester carboxylesterase